jgi:putative hydrolase of the HAD superfamily
MNSLLAGGGAKFVTLTTAVRNALVAHRERGRVLVVVTNGPTLQQEEKLALTGLTNLVDTWAISESEGFRKPEPELFRIAAARVGLPIEGSWMIGDSATADIGGGAAAGCRTVWVSRNRPWPSDVLNPTMAAVDVVAALTAIDTAEPVSNCSPVPSA